MTTANSDQVWNMWKFKKF